MGELCLKLLPGSDNIIWWWVEEHPVWPVRRRWWKEPTNLTVQDDLGQLGEQAFFRLHENNDTNGNDKKKQTKKKLLTNDVRRVHHLIMHFDLYLQTQICFKTYLHSDICLHLCYDNVSDYVLWSSSVTCWPR